MKKTVLPLIAILFLTAAPLFSQTLTGEAYDTNPETAKSLALKDLARQVEVQIISKTSARQSFTQTGNADEYSTSIVTDVNTYTEIPIFGAEVSLSPRNPRGEYRATAELKPQTAVPLYRDRLRQQLTNLNNLNRRQAGASGNRKEQFLLEIISGIRLFGKYRSMLMLLGESSMPDLPVDPFVVAADLRQLQQTLDTLPRAAEYITRTFDQPGIFVYPPSAPNSTEITPFAAVMKEELKSRLRTVDNPDNARYTLRGSYLVSEAGMDISCSLVGLRGNEAGMVIKSATARLLPSAYDGLRWEPSGNDIDALIKNGLVVSSDFNIAVTTNRGSRDLLFTNGESVELLVKMNAPGYFYILSHIDVEGMKFSYLLDLDPNVPGNRRFIFYIGPDEVNRWISLGEFTAGPPFGVERLQFMAGSSDPVDALPQYGYDSATGYYRVGFDPVESLVQTHGLRRTKTEEDKKAEAALTITILP